jgi:hypothetical protein
MSQPKLPPMALPPRPQPPFVLVDRRDYVRTADDWVSLCVVRMGAGKDLRLYAWQMRKGAWKTALCNQSIVKVDLNAMAADAAMFAAEHGIPLKWPPAKP